MALITVLLLACAAGTFAVYVFSAVAFSGSTGQAHTAFLESIQPLFGFAFGAIAAGGIALFVNALATTRGIWFKPIALISIVGGTAAVLIPPLGASLIKLATPAFQLVGHIMLADQGRNAEQEARILQFVKTNQTLIADVGPVKKAWVLSHVKFSSGAPDRYDVAVTGEREVYAIIEVSGRPDQAKFRLLCTTRIWMGSDSHKDPCEQ